MFFNERNKYNIDFGETKVLWHGDVPYIVPEELSVVQERYLLASQQTLYLGNISVDNILKNNYSDFEERVSKNVKEFKKTNSFKKEALLEETLRTIKKQYDSTFNLLSSFDFCNGTESSFVCEVIFSRIHSSFKACRFLIKYGFYFETFAIQRQILEQLAFAYHVSNNFTYTDFTEPNKCISELKKLYPKVGYLYGYLCNKTHIDKSQIKTYLTKNANHESLVIHNSLDYSLETLFYFVILLDIYCCTFEYCFKKFYKKRDFDFLTQKNRLKKNRPTKFLIEKFRLAYKKILELEKS